MTVPGARSRRFFAPLAPAAVAMAVGILADRFGPQFSTFSWAFAGLLLGLLALARPLGGASLILAFAAMGAGWHHARWTDLGDDDLARGKWSSPRPAWVRGVIVEPPRLLPGLFDDDEGRTITQMEVTAISDGDRWHEASSRILLAISGDRTDLQSGLPVFAAGTLGAIPGPRNPGESDRRDRSRAEGIRLRMSVGEPGSVWSDPEGSPRAFDRWLGWMRTRSDALLVRGLDPDVAPLAAALLLGRRDAVDPDVNDAFARTGTTHLLAISGLHMQVLAGVLLLGVRSLGVRWRWSLLIVAAATILYALLVGLTPSVVRSATMTLMFCLGGSCHRCGKPAGLLGVAAIATMTLNPSNLFDAGCQLSFLGVSCLFWLVVPALRLLGVSAAYPTFVPEEPDPAAGREYPDIALDQLERRLAPWWKKVLRGMMVGLGLDVVASVVVWNATEPLVQSWFHLCSPIAMVLNVPLILTTSVALLAAGVTLATSAVAPWLATPSAWVCGWLLRITRSIILWGQDVPGGHWFVPGPSPGWVALFYLALGLAAMASFKAWRIRRSAWVGVLVVNLTIGLLSCFPPVPSTLRADVLAVDHGLAVILQGDDGAVWLYDCGKMRDPRVGRRVIAPALWDRGLSRIDGVILSHADADHFNALPDLLDRFAIGEVRVPPGFGGSNNPDASRLIATVRERGITVRELAAGDIVNLGQNARARALHPPRGWSPEAPDNVRSVVMDVEQNGHHALLTGDLDGPGLSALAEGPSPQPSAMLSPHHGGRTANPAWFYQWAKPVRVVVSQKPPSFSAKDPLAFLEADETPIDRTWNRGALHLGFGVAALSVVGFLDPPAPQDSAAETPERWRIARIVVAVLGLLVGLVVAVVAGIIEWGAWSLVSPGRRRTDGEPEPSPWQPVEVVAGDGATLRGAWLDVESSPGLILFFHGFGADRSGMRERALAMASRGWSVALIDSRGRGESGGSLTAFGGFEGDDARVWLDAMAPRSRRIAVWGRSMGAAIAGRIGDDPRVAALVLEAPYADLKMAVASFLRGIKVPGILAVPMLARAAQIAGVPLRWPRPIEVAHQVFHPVMILHGTDDPVCPPDQATALARAFTGTVELVEIEGARHADVFERGGEELANRVSDWIATIVLRTR